MLSVLPAAYIGGIRGIFIGSAFLWTISSLVSKTKDRVNILLIVSPPQHQAGHLSLVTFRFGLITLIKGAHAMLSIGAGSWPKQPATGQSLAGYFLLT